jgi:hypothetical protein
VRGPTDTQYASDVSRYGHSRTGTPRSRTYLALFIRCDFMHAPCTQTIINYFLRRYWTNGRNMRDLVHARARTCKTSALQIWKFNAHISSSSEVSSLHLHPSDPARTPAAWETESTMPPPSLPHPSSHQRPSHPLDAMDSHQASAEHL